MIKVLFFAVIVAVAYAHGIPNGAKTDDENIVPARLALQLIGTVEGKSFFYDNSVDRNWIEADAFCKKANLRLARIQTTGQLELLALKSPDLGIAYWTAGADARTLSQYRWDTSDTGEVTDIGAKFFPDVVRSALMFSPSGYGALVGNPVGYLAATLCEL